MNYGTVEIGHVKRFSSDIQSWKEARRFGDLHDNICHHRLSNFAPAVLRRSESASLPHLSTGGAILSDILTLAKNEP